MVTAVPPTKAQRRELPRWAKILRLRGAGLTVHELATLEDITPTQVYALLHKAKEAKRQGWI